MTRAGGRDPEPRTRGVDVDVDAVDRILRVMRSYLVRVEELASAHELVDDEVIVGVHNILVEVEARLEVDGLGLGDVRRAHFADAVGVAGGGGWGARLRCVGGCGS